MPPLPVVAQSWLDLRPIGEVIEGTRFFALKTPMTRRIFEANKIRKEKFFTPEDVVKHFVRNGKKVGMIIDLSSGTDYYDPGDLKALGVEGYVRLKTKAKNRSDGLRPFNEIVKDFLNSHPDPDCLIGVHCYHGLQRTSFMICSYMVTEMGIDLETAVERFEAGRGHPIENAKRWLYKEAETGFSKSK